jgi:hypothetical protein
MTHPRQFDPAELNDPVALKTSWSPLKRGGTNFRTHALFPLTPQRMEFQPTVASKVVGWVFLGVGVLVELVAVVLVLLAQLDLVVAIGLLLFGLVFVVVGVLLKRFIGRPITFDLATRVCARGKPGAADVSLGSLHALQVVSEYCSGQSSFYSYELNLVMNDGTRHNVVDHGSLDALRSDAAQLARFLRVPLWDPT